MAYAFKTYVLKAPQGRGQNEAPVINETPKEPLMIWTFGGGIDDHLGLGLFKSPDGDKFPCADWDICRHDPTQVAFGRDHAVLLTADGNVMTWGGNQFGSLGRNTHFSFESIEHQDDLLDHHLLYQAIPKSHFPATRPITFTAVAATEYASYVLTQDGFVFGWGMHRSNDGVLKITKNRQIQISPALHPILSKITQLAAGYNHVLALNTSGDVFAWGAGDIGQLGRRLTQRRMISGLRQARCLSGKCVSCIFAGGDTSFAITEDGQVYAWGSNNFGQCGLPNVSASEITKPTLSKALTDAKIHTIAAGQSHAIGITADGTVMAWGRCDAMQLGIRPEELELSVKRDRVRESHIMRDYRDVMRAVLAPVSIDGIKGALAVAAGDQTSFAIDGRGCLWAWGCGDGYGHGLGEEVDSCARVVDTGGRPMTWVAASNNFGACGRPKTQS